MLYKALKSFSGLISMYEGEVKELSNKDIIDDLLNAKYIELVNTKKEVKRKAPKGE